MLEISNDLSITLFLSGLAVGIVTFFFQGLYKFLVLKRRMEISKEVHWLKENSVDLFNKEISFQTENDLSETAQFTNELLEEVKQGIVKDIIKREGISREQMQEEVDVKMAQLGSRVEIIEKRLPDTTTIDKVASINDALLAQRVEQISSQIEAMSQKMLTRWDVALLFCKLIAGICFIVGATYGVISFVSEFGTAVAP